MGASQSHNIVQRTRLEEDENDVPPLQPDEKNKIKPYIPRPPPTWQRLETFEEKAYRKVGQVLFCLNGSFRLVIDVIYDCFVAIRRYSAEAAASNESHAITTHILSFHV